MIYQFFYDTPLGKAVIAEEDGEIVYLNFSEDYLTDAVLGETETLRKCAEELEAYFAGEGTVFTGPVAFRGTAFQNCVWRAMMEVPYGKTASYGEIAKAIGNPKAARAVGMANNRNDISILIPSHRIIGANGSLVGYGGRLDKKQYLLNLESGKALGRYAKI